MKKLATCILLIFFCSSAFAQFKVKDRSGRSPKWLHTLEQGYLITEGRASTLEEAQQICLMNLKQLIAESIATRITAVSEFEKTETYQGNNSDSQGRFHTAIVSRTARLPFINDISLSKAEDFYWELRYWKKEKSYEYYYSLKYPFSDFELKKLALEFEEHDNGLNLKVEELSDNVDKIQAIEDIEICIAELRRIRNEFTEDDPRSSRCDQIINQYNHLYERISIQAAQSGKGVIELYYTFDGHFIKTSQKPMIKASWESPKIKYEFTETGYQILYDDYACYPEDENFLEIRIKAGNRWITERIYIHL